MTALQELIAAVEAGTASVPVKEGMHPHTRFLSAMPDGYCGVAILAYDGSFDAALTVMTGIIPDWRVCDLGQLPRTGDWTAAVLPRGTSEGTRYGKAAISTSPGRALFLAILRAHQAQQEGKG